MKFHNCPKCGLTYDRHARGKCPHCVDLRALNRLAFAVGAFVVGLLVTYILFTYPLLTP